MTIDQRFFCSDVSRRHNEQIYGTAGRGYIWLLLEYPKPWTRKLLTESALSDETKTYIRDLLNIIPNSRMLFISQGSSRKEKISLFIVICQEKEPYTFRFYLDDYEDLLNINIPALIREESPWTVKNYSPLFLVCTDGKHDKCCAKFGFPIFKSFRDYTGDLVWESSHVGGDRFAANVVCFPHGIFYGHVTQHDLWSIVDGYREQKVYLNKYRGRACYSRQAQVGEYFIRYRSGIESLNDLYLIDVSQNADEEEWQVRFASAKYGKIHEVTFSSFKSSFEYHLTCNSTEEKSVAQYSLSNYSVKTPPSSMFESD